MAGKTLPRRPIAEINVVPYIDVMLVLLVIFMVTAPLLQQGVEVSLPQAGAEPLEEKKLEPLVVTVDEQGRYYVNIGKNTEEPLKPDTLMARTAAVLRNKPGTPVLVRGDEAVSYGQVVRVMALLQQAGAPNVGLMTRPPPQTQGS